MIQFSVNAYNQIYASVWINYLDINNYFIVWLW